MVVYMSAYVSMLVDICRYVCMHARVMLVASNRKCGIPQMQNVSNTGSPCIGSYTSLSSEPGT